MYESFTAVLIAPSPRIGILLEWAPCFEAELPASSDSSASRQHVKEDIRILAIVKAILKLREVPRQVSLADLVIGANEPAL